MNRIKQKSTLSCTVSVAVFCECFTVSWVVFHSKREEIIYLYILCRLNICQLRISDKYTVDVALPIFLYFCSFFPYMDLFLNSVPELFWIIICGLLLPLITGTRIHHASEMLTSMTLLMLWTVKNHIFLSSSSELATASYGSGWWRSSRKIRWLSLLLEEETGSQVAGWKNSNW